MSCLLLCLVIMCCLCVAIFIMFYCIRETSRPPDSTLAMPPSEELEQSCGISLKKLLDQNSSVGLLPWSSVLTAGQLKRCEFVMVVCLFVIYVVLIAISHINRVG